MELAMGWAAGAVAMLAVMYFGPLDRIAHERDALKAQCVSTKPSVEK